MGSKVFLYLFIAANLLLVVWMLAMKRTSKPTPLNLGGKDSLGSSPPQSTDSRKFNSQAPPAGGSRERSLNCLFMYNGHSFDAFEVLGLPAGSSQEACIRASIDLRKKRPQDAEFLDALVAAVQLQIPR